MNNREAFEAQRVLINLFERWKGYELPDLNSDNQFDKEWLHREWVAFQAGHKLALASHQQDHIPNVGQMVPSQAQQPTKLVFDSESARQFLIESVLPKFSDSTFQKYVLEELAGDFAYQLAMYLQSQAHQDDYASHDTSEHHEWLRQVESENVGKVNELVCDASQAQQLTNIRQIVKNAILSNSHPAENWYLAFNDAEEIDIVSNQVAIALPNDFGDPYQGAREDLAIWKKRALEAESKLQSQAQQTESKLDCVKVTTGDHDKFHELLEAILNAGERVAMPVSFLSIINEAGMKFIKLLPPAPEGDKP